MNLNAICDNDPLYEFPNAQGVQPSTMNILFPSNRNMLKNFTTNQCNVLLGHYNYPAGFTNHQHAINAVRIFIGTSPF
jgi:hypothetical protein